MFVNIPELSVSTIQSKDGLNIVTLDVDVEDGEIKLVFSGLGHNSVAKRFKSYTDDLSDTWKLALKEWAKFLLDRGESVSNIRDLIDCNFDTVYSDDILPEFKMYRVEYTYLIAKEDSYFVQASSEKEAEDKFNNSSYAHLGVGVSSITNIEVD